MICKSCGRRSLKKRLDKAKKNLASVRDELRSIAEDADTCCDSAERGLRELEHAIDTLSEYV